MNHSKSPEAISSKTNTASQSNNSATIFFLAVAVLALGQALQNGLGFYTIPAIVWLTIALLVTGLSFASQYRSCPTIPNKLNQSVLVGGLIWLIYQSLTTLPGISIAENRITELWLYQAAVLVGGICALASLAPNAWLSNWLRNSLVALVFLAMLVAGLWLIHASPNPTIDTYVFHQTSSQALLQGNNPYEQTPPNIYGDSKYYGAEWVNEDQLTIGNPYPPLSIYLSTIGYILVGDIRYSHLIALVLAGILMACMSTSQEARLAAYIFIFTPRALFVLEQSWTEPLVLVLAVGVVWSATHHPAWKFIVLGLSIASKQYMIFLFPLFILLIPPGSSKRVWVQASTWIIGIAFLVTAPLALWNFPAFLWNVGLAQWYQVFRIESLSYAVVYFNTFGQAPSQFVPFLLLGATLLLAWRYGARTPAGFAISMALGLGLFFAFSKQAFCNYYFLVTGLLCCALAAVQPSKLDSAINLERTPIVP